MPRKGYLQIKVSPAEHDTLRRLAAESQVTVSDWIRGAIRAKTASQTHGHSNAFAQPVIAETYKLLSRVRYPELDAIREELRAPDFEYLQLLFVPGDPAQSLELWCRAKGQLETKRQEWYREHAKRIAELRNRTQTSPKLPIDNRSGPV